MITSKIIANGILRAVTSLALVALILYVLFQIKTVLIYCVMALVLSLIGKPIIEFLKRKLRFNHLIATITTLSLFMMIFAGFIMMFIPLIVAQGENLSLLNTSEIQKNSLLLIHEISNFLERNQIDSGKMLRELDITSKVNFALIPNFFDTLFGTLTSFGMGLLSVLFICFFFMKDRKLFFDGIKFVLPYSHEKRILHSLNKINYLLSRYFLGLTLQLFILFVFYFILLLLFDVKNAFVIAFLCACLNIIPYIGPFIGLLLVGLLTMLSNIGHDFQTEILPTTLYVMIGFLITQLIDNIISQPIIFSKSVNSHPIEIFLVILSAGYLFGIMGMIVAIPLYTILKVIGKEFLPENKVIKLLTEKI